MCHYRQGKPWIWVEGTEVGARFLSQILASSLVESQKFMVMRMRKIDLASFIPFLCSFLYF